MVGNVLARRLDPQCLFISYDSFLLKITDASSGLPAPRVLGVSPARGPSAGGTEVTISGMNFLPGAAVRIAGVLAGDARVLNAATIKAVAAPNSGRLQNLDVAVINPDGQSNALVEAFSYVLPPVITQAAISGKDLLVSGTDFDSGAVILVDGQKQKTIARETEVGTVVLVGKKVGKRIKPGQTVMLQVQNSDGQISLTTPFTRPPQ